jgi:hypothetical protein
MSSQMPQPEPSTPEHSSSKSHTACNSGISPSRINTFTDTANGTSLFTGKPSSERGDFSGCSPSPSPPSSPSSPAGERSPARKPDEDNGKAATTEQQSIKEQVANQLRGLTTDWYGMANEYSMSGRALYGPNALCVDRITSNEASSERTNASEAGATCGEKVPFERTNPGEKHIDEPKSAEHGEWVAVSEDADDGEKVQSKEKSKACK